MMLCTLAVHLTREGSYTLRVRGRTASGSSGAGGQGTKDYLTVAALLTALERFGLGGDVAAATVQQLANSKVRKRFLTFAEDVRIPFESLESADIYLFD